jgi:CDP-diacylglycerol--glycerol-3-phosphate 3-phosphatidyltransferase
MDRKRKLIAILTLIRIPLALGFLFAGISSGIISSLLMVAIAVINELSDMSDGWLARHLDAVTAAGGVLDSGTDQVARSLEFIGLACRGAMPIWLLAVFVCRDSVVMSLRQLADLNGPRGRLRTRLSGKLKGIAQGACLIVVSLSIAWQNASHHQFHYSVLIFVAELLAGAVTAISLADYAVFYALITRSARPK